MFNWKMTPREWQIFAVCLIPGLTWGLVGLMIAHRIFGLNQSSRFLEWDVARPSIVAGMTFGVPIYAVNWLRRGCPQFKRFRDHLLESVNCIFCGLVCGCFGWGLIAIIAIFFGQFGAMLMAMVAPVVGLYFAFFTVIPASLLMRPLVHLLLEKWFEEFQVKWRSEHQNQIPQIKNQSLT